MVVQVGQPSFASAWYGLSHHLKRRTLAEEGFAT